MYGIVANILIGLLKSLYGLALGSTPGGSRLLLSPGSTSAPSLGTTVATNDGLNFDGGGYLQWVFGGTVFIRFGGLGEGTAFKNTQAYAWASGDPSGTSADTGLVRLAAGVIGAVAGYAGAAGGWLQNTAGWGRVTTQFDKVDATLANVTGLSVTLVAGRTYKFIASLPVTAAAVGGYKVAMAGTCTATAVYYDVVVETNGVAPSLTRVAALAGTASGTLGTTVRIWIEGVITVNAGGTLTVQFAQSAANGTSSVLVGADLFVEDVP